MQKMGPRSFSTVLHVFCSIEALKWFDKDFCILFLSLQDYPFGLFFFFFFFFFLFKFEEEYFQNSLVKKKYLLITFLFP